jgi:hypothetical protein
MANGHGGRRPGAGRKRTRVELVPVIEEADLQIAGRLPHLIEKLFELAEGVNVQGCSLDGEEKVYTRPPCYKSLSYLVDRVMGRPTQATEVSGPDGGPMEVGLTFEQAVKIIREEDAQDG